MPLVHIDFIEGRSEDQLRKLVKDITEVIGKDLNAPAEHVHIVLNELPASRLADAGKLRSDED
ncbi:2-hydroxymuconate tautomerase [Xylocopilactobacillus apicola]|uniref:Tautomerase n=1 Tax=Xylocopilactobacillus apicola TaxID=2932184 RepID=A0AAU9D558_9LACO|nr:2-hydroxymuconate tautomerase [Xylocopilactobacillus apicola]BDR58618.1 tautomerase [Xylocopilactobacillus apicola]